MGERGGKSSVEGRARLSGARTGEQTDGRTDTQLGQKGFNFGKGLSGQGPGPGPGPASAPGLWCFRIWTLRLLRTIIIMLKCKGCYCSLDFTPLLLLLLLLVSPLQHLGTPVSQLLLRCCSGHSQSTTVLWLDSVFHLWLLEY